MVGVSPEHLAVVELLLTCNRDMRCKVPGIDVCQSIATMRDGRGREKISVKQDCRNFSVEVRSWLESRQLKRVRPPGTTIG